MHGRALDLLRRGVLARPRAAPPRAPVGGAGHPRRRPGHALLRPLPRRHPLAAGAPRRPPPGLLAPRRPHLPGAGPGDGRGEPADRRGAPPPVGPGPDPAPGLAPGPGRDRGVSPAALALLAAAAAAPELVDVARAVPEASLDIRYATSR